jgi:hypothetical protein
VAMTFNSFLMSKCTCTGCCLACAVRLTRFPVHGLVVHCVNSTRLHLHFDIQRTQEATAWPVRSRTVDH